MGFIKDTPAFERMLDKEAVIPVTTRFSLSELAEMLHVHVDAVRSAVDALAAEGGLTAESFPFGDRNWRIAPSDTKRIQTWIEKQIAAGGFVGNSTHRKVTRKVIRRPSDRSSDSIQ